MVFAVSSHPIRVVPVWLLVLHDEWIGFAPDGTDSFVVVTISMIPNISSWRRIISVVPVPVYILFDVCIRLT